MKKIIGYVIALVMIISCTTNCFAYTKVKDLAYIEKDRKYILLNGKAENINEITYKDYKIKYPEERLDGGCFRSYIVCTDFKYINGTAMIKVKDAVSAMGGKIEYNSNTKSIKAYIPNFSNTCNAIKSFSITTNKKDVDFTVRSPLELYYSDAQVAQGSFTFKIAPTIIDGSLYVSAIDFGNLVGKYFTTGNGQIKYEVESSEVKVLNNILYILVFGYYP